MLITAVSWSCNKYAVVMHIKHCPTVNIVPRTPSKTLKKILLSCTRRHTISRAIAKTTKARKALRKGKEMRPPIVQPCLGSDGILGDRHMNPTPTMKKRPSKYSPPRPSCCTMITNVLLPNVQKINYRVPIILGRESQRERKENG
jgi:hypothetical protein